MWIKLNHKDYWLIDVHTPIISPKKSFGYIRLFVREYPEEKCAQIKDLHMDSFNELVIYMVPRKNHLSLAGDMDSGTKKDANFEMKLI